MDAVHIALGVVAAASATAAGTAVFAELHRWNAKGELVKRLKSVLPLNGLQQIDYEKLKLEKKPFAKGTFGVVYEAIYTNSQSEKIRVAVKTVKDISSNAEHLKQGLSIELLLECQRIMQVCSHPRVVSIHGYSVNIYLHSTSPFDTVTKPEYDVFLVMERCEKSLWEFLKGTGEVLDPKQLLNIAAQIAQGMRYVAEQGIVHRDLRSENILMTELGKVIKIGDFGLSRNMIHVYNTVYYRGNSKSQYPAHWAAPEVIKEHKWSEKSDVWSYGVIMIELYTAGKVPSPMVAPVHGRENIMLFEKPRACPDDIYKDLIVKCWEVDPRLRPTFNEISNILAGLHV